MTHHAIVDPIPFRKREPNEGQRIAREAGLLMQPVNDQIGRWQASTARLLAVASRMKQTGRHDPGPIEAIYALLGYVEEQARRLDEQIAEMPDDVARHSRVTDSSRALQAIATQLRNALKGFAA